MNNVTHIADIAAINARPPLRYVMRRWWSVDQDHRGTSWMYLFVTLIYNSAFAVILTVFFLAL